MLTPQDINEYYDQLRKSNKRWLFWINFLIVLNFILAFGNMFFFVESLFREDIKWLSLFAFFTTIGVGTFMSLVSKPDILKTLRNIEDKRQDELEMIQAVFDYENQTNSKNNNS